MKIQISQNVFLNVAQGEERTPYLNVVQSYIDQAHRLGRQEWMIGDFVKRNHYAKNLYIAMKAKRILQTY